MNFKNLFYGLMLVWALCFMSFQGVAQQKLAYNLQKNDVFRIKQQAKQLIIQELDGAKHELTNDLEALFTFKVVEVNANQYTIALAFEDFGMKTTSNLQGEIINVKASKPVDGDIMSEMFSGLVGYQLQLIMEKNGKIIKADGGDKLIENMLSKANINDEFTKNLMRKSLGKEFSSDGLAQSFEQMTYFYPQNSVSLGDVWNNSFTGKLEAENTWKLDQITGGEAQITGDAAIILETDENGTTMSLSGTQQTRVTTTVGNGFIKTINSESFVQGVSKMAQLPNVEVPTSIKSTISYELIQ